MIYSSRHILICCSERTDTCAQLQEKGERKPSKRLDPNLKKASNNSFLSVKHQLQSRVPPSAWLRNTTDKN